MPTATFTFLIPKGAGNLNNGINLNLGSKFTADIEKSPISRITAITCSYEVSSTSHRESAQFQTTLSDSPNNNYTSNIITKTLSSSNGHVATINNTFSTFPPNSFFNNASGTNVLLKQTASVGEVNLRYKSDRSFYVTITVTYEGGPSIYVYDNGWKEATPYVYTENGWKEATLSVYNEGWN